MLLLKKSSEQKSVRDQDQHQDNQNPERARKPWEWLSQGGFSSNGKEWFTLRFCLDMGSGVWEFR
ncbi:uncharacterized protein EAF01_010186 [Botrytis porri]|uniref:uncharacterized protein n=1 Tax=Botrytis porri TaxID=87229 RepID=UPI00190222AA|nr:uncharacterized protein EAF01_010186 [Botrytis porri]KAF7894736.1 hypothetical protein EAF01_010186 [Botrytis porri]